MLFRHRFFILLLFPGLFFVGACSDFDEMKSQKLYAQAQRQVEEGQRTEAEETLTRLLELYPDTQMALRAKGQLDQIRQQRISNERKKFSRVLDSYRQVFSGYYSVYAEYPKSISEFDTSGFFFDSQYLAEVAGENFQVYLWLTGGDEGFRAWCVDDESSRGYSVDGNSRGLTAFDRQETIASLEQRFEVNESFGRLTVLVPRL